MGTEVIPKSEEAVPAEKASSLEMKIISQIEYYFGDYNLTRDKFLREQLKLDDGWVPLETMVKFNRLKKLTEDFNVIADALRKSPRQLMEINEDCTKIRRRTAAPLPEDHYKRAEDTEKRTLYVKGFKKTSTLDELLEFFKDYKVVNVFMRKLKHQNDKPFKGSVFVTFETREDAEKFLETKGIQYCGIDLLKEWRVDYMKRKDEQFSEIKALKEKKMQLKKQEKAKEEEEGQKAAENEMVPGSLLKIVDLKEDTMREHIIEFFEPHGTLLFTDYSRGKPSAVVRFEGGQATSVLEKVLTDGKTVKIGSSDANISVMEGDEEKEYWKTIAISKAQRRKNNKTHNRGNRNFQNRNFQNKKRKWGNRKKERNEDDENYNDGGSAEPPKKKTKAETSKVSTVKDSAMEVNSDATSEQKKTEVEPQEK